MKVFLLIQDEYYDKNASHIKIRDVYKDQAEAEKALASIREKYANARSDGIVHYLMEFYITSEKKK